MDGTYSFVITFRRGTVEREYAGRFPRDEEHGDWVKIFSRLGAARYNARAGVAMEFAAGRNQPDVGGGVGQ